MTGLNKLVMYNLRTSCSYSEQLEGSSICNDADCSGVLVELKEEESAEAANEFILERPDTF